MEAPGEYKTAGILMVIAAGLTLLWSLLGIAGLVLSLAGMCCAPYYLLPIGLGIYELVGGVSAASGRPNSSVKLSAIAGLIAAVLCCNFIGIVLEILALVFLSRPEIADFIEG
jgi:hypothetical protein